MSEMLRIDASDFDRLQDAIKQFPGNAERTINDVLHNEGGLLIQDSVKRLIPESGKHWKGKAAPAASSNSLRSTNSNLAVTVRSTKRYQYLYFPDDGSTTRRHVGNQHFFHEGAEAVSDDIVERCIEKLINTFEEGE
jgi:hypothetical protein